MSSVIGPSIRPYFELSPGARRVSHLLSRGHWLLYRLDSAFIVAGRNCEADEDVLKSNNGKLGVSLSCVSELISAGHIRPLSQFRFGYVCGWSELLVDQRDGHDFDVYGLWV